MPPRLNLLRTLQQPRQGWLAVTHLTSSLSFLPLLPGQQQQSRNAHILASLSDNPGAYSKKIRRGRGPASGKGKTGGRGHKGQKKRNKPPTGFNGGQTPEIVVHGERGFKNVFTVDLAPVNLDRIQDWIDQGRIDPTRPITVRELAQSRCIHQAKEGVKLLGRGAGESGSAGAPTGAGTGTANVISEEGETQITNVLKQPIHIVVSRASASAITAVEAAGGSVTTRYYTRSAIVRIMRREMHPFVSMAWTDQSGTEALHQVDPASAATVQENDAHQLIESNIMKQMGFRYRLPDPTKRRDIEYYRDPAHRGYLSHLLKPMEGPSLFFRSPVDRKSSAGVKREKVLPENRLW